MSAEREFDISSELPDDGQELLPLNPPAFLVGVGSSAGGLEALQELMRGLRPDLPAAILVAQHLAPQHKSLLAELLGRQGHIPVRVARHGAVPQAGVVHVCPPNADITISDGRIRLTEPASMVGPKPSVDALLTSIASEYQQRSAGIILSGTGSDGTYGMREVHAAGGLTIAQDPGTAKYPTMPQSALDSGIVDRSTAPQQMGILLESFMNGTLEQNDDVSSLPQSNIRRILSVMHSHTGIDYSDYKESTIRRQIARRMAVLQIEDQSDYVTYLLSDDAEARILGQNMLVSVTSFYRDPEVWDALSGLVSQMLEGATVPEPLRLWVPGCATGEEAYTIAMIVARALGHPAELANRIKVFATDLDTNALEFGRRGVYPAAAATRLPEDLRGRYLEPAGSNVAVSPFLKDCVVFARHNLATDPPFLHMNLVSCRNVLIYFQQDLQEQVLNSLHYALDPGGLLVLGHSESVTPIGEALLPAIAKLRIYRRGVQPVQPPLPSRTDTTRTIRGIRPPRHPRQTDDIQILREALLRALTSPSLVVNESGSVVQVLGDVSRFCQFPEGSLDLSASAIVRPALQSEVRRLLSQVRNSEEPSVGIPVDVGHPEELVRVSVRPVPSSLGSFALISFESLPTPDDHRPAADVDDSAIRAELDSTREALQATIEELETSNEELQALNEEMMASTEELQASNEELGTLNEELQASNEELGTLNEELQIRTRELANINLDLRNLQDAITQAFVLVDRDGRVKRFSPLAVRLFALVEQDIGVPLVSVATTHAIQDLKRALDSVIAGNNSEILRVEGPDVEYQVAITAYLDAAGEVDGAVVSINDLRGTQASRQDFGRLDHELVDFADSFGVGVWSRSQNGRLVSVSAEAADLTGTTPQQLLEDPSAWLANVVPEDLEQARSASAPQRPDRLEYRTEVDGRIRTIVDVVHIAVDPAIGNRIGTLQDITQIGSWADAVADAAAFQEAEFSLPGRLLLILDPQGRIHRAGQRTAELLDLPEQALVGRTLTDLFAAEWRTGLTAWVAGLPEAPANPMEAVFVDRNGHVRHLRIRGTTVQTSVGSMLLVSLEDFTREVVEADRLRKTGQTDALTGLPSRLSMGDTLLRSIENARTTGRQAALLWIDLDGFKDINDRFGHPAGDDVLAEVALRMRSAARGSDFLARIGGDEFALLIDDVRRIQQLDAVAERLLHSLRGAIDLPTATGHVTASIGIAVFPDDAEDADSLLRAADTAMYAAKREGGDRYRFHQPGMHVLAQESAQKRQDLAEAIRNESFTLRYQPIFNLESGEIVAAEALVRRRLPDGDLQTAGAFIRTAQDSGHVRALGRLVVNMLARDLAGELPEDLLVTMNISAAELNDPGLMTYLRQSPILPSLPRIMVEVTEQALLEPRSVGMESLTMLRSLGARIAIDDYGTGFSNMASLQNVGPNLIKVDGSFTERAAREDPLGMALLRSAKAIADSLGCAVLAEGISTSAHLDAVRDVGIELGQGFFLGEVVEARRLPSHLGPLEGD